MSLLIICQDAAEEIGGIDSPSQIIGNTEPTAVALLAAARREGRILRKAKPGGWVRLQREHEFTTVASQAEYALPADYHAIIDQSIWDRQNYWQMRGPTGPVEWQEIKSGLIASAALRRRFRLKRAASSSDFTKKFVVDPTPTTAGETLVFEYISTHWLTNAAGDTGYDRWQADTDEPLLDSDLITMGVIWRFNKARGFSFAADLAEYEIERDREIARDGGAPVLHIGRRRRRFPLGNVPETGFGP